MAARIRAAALAALPDEFEAAPNPELARFYRLLREYPSRPGKTIRGRLLVLSALAHGVSDDAQALGVAAALELFQAWALIHDDIEDESELRRGLPTLHRQVGIPIALNVGDALHAYMWRQLLAAARLPAGPTNSGGAGPATAETILAEFSEMILRTTEGQHLELSLAAASPMAASEAAYLEVVRLKTAYYTVVSPLRLGAACAGRRLDPRLDEAAFDLGTAFQIRDDVLNLADAAPDEPEARAGARYGKEHAGDLLEGKRTLILAHLLSHAPPAERAELGALLAKPRAHKSAADVARLLSAIGQYGSLDYARQRAADLATRGNERLGEALADLPLKAAAGQLGELLASLAGPAG